MESYDPIEDILTQDDEPIEPASAQTDKHVGVVNHDEDNVFYDIDNNDLNNDELDFMIEQNANEFALKHDDKQQQQPDQHNHSDAHDDKELFLNDLNDDNCSEIIELRTNFTFKDTQETIANVHEIDDCDKMEETNTSGSAEVINNLVNDLIDRVDKNSNEDKLNEVSLNVSKITIQKITDKESTKTIKTSKSSIESNRIDLDNDEALSQKEDIPRSSNEKNDTIPALIDLRRRPNILRKRRHAHSMTSDSQSKQKTISELLSIRNIYNSEVNLTGDKTGIDDDDLHIDDPFTQIDTAKTKPPTTQLKNRIRKKTTVFLIKEVETCYYREYLDANNNVVRVEKTEEKKTRDVLQRLEKDTIVTKKSTRLVAQPELSSSSSINVISSDDDLDLIKNTRKKSHKIALSNRYLTKSPPQPAVSVNGGANVAAPQRTRNVSKTTSKAQNRKQQKEAKSPKTAFNFSNLRFKLTPEERKKDLEQLKNSTLLEPTESPDQLDTLHDIDNFLVEFSHEIESTNVVAQQPSPLKQRPVNFDCRVRLSRLPQSEFDRYNEKYKCELKKPKTKFKLDDKVFVRVEGSSIYTPAIVTGIKPMSKGPANSSFFPVSCSPFDIYYLYECKHVEKRSELKFSDTSVDYLKEEYIIHYDLVQINDDILVWNDPSEKYIEAKLVRLTVNKDLQVLDFWVKSSRSRSKQSIPFQYTALKREDVEKIQTRLKSVNSFAESPTSIESSQIKSDKKKKRFSYVNRSTDSDIIEETIEDEHAQSEDDDVPAKKKNRLNTDDDDDDAEYVINDDVQEEEIEELVSKMPQSKITRRRTSKRTPKPKSAKHPKPRSSITINKMKNTSKSNLDGSLIVTRSSPNKLSSKSNISPSTSSKTVLQWNRSSNSQTSLLSDDSLDLTICRAVAATATATPQPVKQKSETVRNTKKKST